MITAIIKTTADKPQILLAHHLRATDSKMYTVLAGFVEVGESLEQCVHREVMEEVGLSVSNLRYFGSQPWPFPANLMLGAHGAALTEAITLDPAELQDALWISREELLQVFSGRHARIKPPRKGAIAELLMRNWLADRPT